MPHTSDLSMENKYSWDTYKDFTIRAKRNKLLALWVSQKLCLTPQETENLSKELIKKGIYSYSDSLIADIIYEAFKFNGKTRHINKHIIYTQMERLDLLIRHNTANTETYMPMQEIPL